MMKTAIMVLALLCGWAAVPALAGDCATEGLSRYAGMVGKTAEEAGLDSGSPEEIAGAICGHEVSGIARYAEQGGRLVITRLDLNTGMPYGQGVKALKELYDVPFDKGFIPHTARDGHGEYASFFTGSGTAGIEWLSKWKGRRLVFSNAVPDLETLPVLPVTLQQVNEQTGLELRLDEGRMRNARIARIRYGDNPVFRIRYATEDGRELRFYMQGRQTNVNPCQFDPDADWKLDWELEDIIGDPDDDTGLKLTSYSLDSGGLGSVCWFDGGNFGVMALQGADKAVLDAAMAEWRGIIAAGRKGGR